MAARTPRRVPASAEPSRTERVSAMPWPPARPTGARSRAAWTTARGSRPVGPAGGRGRGRRGGRRGGRRRRRGGARVRDAQRDRHRVRVGEPVLDPVPERVGAAEVVICRVVEAAVAVLVRSCRGPARRRCRPRASRRPHRRRWPGSPGAATWNSTPRDRRRRCPRTATGARVRDRDVDIAPRSTTRGAHRRRGSGTGSVPMWSSSAVVGVAAVGTQVERPVARSLDEHGGEGLAGQQIDPDQEIVGQDPGRGHRPASGRAPMVPVSAMATGRSAAADAVGTAPSSATTTSDHRGRPERRRSITRPVDPAATGPCAVRRRGVAASSACSMPSMNASTSRSSSCVPAASPSRSSASSTSSALRYGRVVVIAENASATARIRAMSGIASPARSVEVALAVPALVVVADAGPDDLDVRQVADDHVAERDVLLDDRVLGLGQLARACAGSWSGMPILPTSWSRPAIADRADLARSAGPGARRGTCRSGPRPRSGAWCSGPWCRPR